MARSSNFNMALWYNSYVAYNILLYFLTEFYGQRAVGTDSTTDWDRNMM